MYSRVNSNIRIGDLSGMSNRIVDFLQSQNLTPYGEYVKIVSDVETLTEAFTVALKRNDIESELAELDAVRDEDLRDLNNILKGYASMRASEVREPGQRLLTIFNKYGLEIANYRYDAQSGNMKSLLKDFETTQAVVDIAALPHVQTAVDALGQAQQTFENKKIAYDQAIETRKENSQSASALKPQLLDVINNKMVNYHVATVQFKDANFKNIADTINNWITDANRNAQNGPQEPDPDADPNPDSDPDPDSDPLTRREA